MKKFLNPLLLLLIPMHFSLSSCNSQNELIAHKIIAIDRTYRILGPLNTIDLKKLEERKDKTEDDGFNKLKKSVSKESLNDIVITLYNEHFNSKEIDELYEYTLEYKNYPRNNLFDLETNQPKSEISLSPELDKKRGVIFSRLLYEGDKVYQNFKRKLYVLDSTNYDANENFVLGCEYKSDRVDGIYETSSFIARQYGQNLQEYLNSITIKQKPSLSHHEIKKIEILPEHGSSLFYEINIHFKREVSKKLFRLTRHNVDKPLAIVVDNKIIFAPIIREPIDGGKLSIVGKISYQTGRFVADNFGK